MRRYYWITDFGPSEAGGGLTPILSPSSFLGAIRSVNPLVAYLIIFNSVVAVWSAPGASAWRFLLRMRARQCAFRLCKTAGV